MNIFSFGTFLFLVSAFLLPIFAYAITVQNEVSVQASTGGNNSSVQVVEGKGEVSVYVETTVDGKVVHYVDETKQSEAGESVEIEKKLEHTSGEGSVEVQTEAGATSATQSENNEEQNNEEIVAESEVELNQLQKQSQPKPLVVRIVKFFRNLFSGFFA